MARPRPQLPQAILVLATGCPLAPRGTPQRIPLGYPQVGERIRRHDRKPRGNTGREPSEYPGFPVTGLSGVPQRQKPGGQHVAGGTFKGSPQAPTEGPEPRVIRVRLSSRMDDLARQGLHGLLVTGREREGGQRLGSRLGEPRQTGDVDTSRLDGIA
jgi:hypothetical protein